MVMTFCRLECDPIVDTEILEATEVQCIKLLILKERTNENQYYEPKNVAQCTLLYYFVCRIHPVVGRTWYGNKYINMRT